MFLQSESLKLFQRSGCFPEPLLFLLFAQSALTLRCHRPPLNTSEILSLIQQPTQLPSPPSSPRRDSRQRSCSASTIIQITHSTIFGIDAVSTLAQYLPQLLPNHRSASPSSTLLQPKAYSATRVTGDKAAPAYCPEYIHLHHSRSIHPCLQSEAFGFHDSKSPQLQRTFFPSNKNIDLRTLYLTGTYLFTMATDMDIEMDIDMGFSEQDLAVQDIEIVPESVVSFTAWLPTLRLMGSILTLGAARSASEQWISSE